MKQESVEDVTTIPQKFVVNSIANSTTYEGEYVQIFDIADGITSDLPVTYSCYYDLVVDGVVANTNLCSGISNLSFDTNTGYFYWTLDYTQGDTSPTYEFKITASDSDASDDEYFTIKVLNKNLAPDLGDLAPITVTEGSLYTFDFDDLSGGDTDFDGDANLYYCTYVRDDLTIGTCTELNLSLNLTSGLMSWTPNLNHSYTNKTLDLNIVVSDGLLYKEHALIASVIHTNQAPLITTMNFLKPHFQSNEIEIYQGRLFDGLDFYHQFTINGTFDLDNASTIAYCYYDTVVDKKVTGLGLCSDIGLSFDLIQRRFVYDKSIVIPEGTYEIKLKVVDFSFQSETLFFKTTHPQLMEDIDEDGDQLTYKCYYDEVVDASVLSVQNCSLANIILNENTGELTWIPPFAATDKEYEIKIVADDGVLSSEEIFVFKSTYTNRLNFKTMAIGENFQCAITNGGDLLCWGFNIQGSLGTNDTFERKVPYNVSKENSILVPFSDIVINGNFACALNIIGQVYCWGDNTYGQLGTGLTQDVYLPNKINTSAMLDETIIKIALASSSTCILNQKNETYCFGLGTSGQLGDSLASSVFKPTNKVYFSGKTSKTLDIVGGENHFCTLEDNGDSYCWGDNSLGQFGRGNSVSSNFAVKSNVANAIKIDAKANQTCILDQDHDLYCFGTNTLGELGIGTFTAFENTPQLVASNVHDFSVGSNFMCYIDASNSYVTMCAGTNAEGELGDSLLSGVSSNIPIQTDAYSNQRNIFTGVYKACSIGDLGPVCWGKGDSHLYANLSTASQTTPTLVNLNILYTDEIDIIDVGLGDGFGCTLNSQGQIYCFGDNTSFNLGMGEILLTSRPTQIFPQGRRFYDLKVGKKSVCAKERMTNLQYCFGDNTFGIVDFINIGTNISVNTLYGSVVSSAMSSFGNHACFINEDQNMICSGDNSSSQLGIGTVSATEDVSLVDTSALPSNIFKQVVTGESHSCGLSTSTSIYCFGKGSSYQLGQGLNTDEITPAALDTSSLTNTKFIKVFANHNNTCGIDSSYQLVCFGDNTYGQLGQGSTSVVTKPKLVQTSHLPSKVYFKDIVIGEKHICGLTFEGELYCVGDNTLGQFGDTGTTSSYYLKKVSNNISPDYYYTKIASFKNTICAVNSDKKLYCWGENNSSMFGDFSSALTSLVPILIEHN